MSVQSISSTWTFQFKHDFQFIGAYLFPFYFAGGYYAGQLILNWRRNYWADRDAVLRHYIQLHPEDFPPPGIIMQIVLRRFLMSFLLIIQSN